MFNSLAFLEETLCDIYEAPVKNAGAMRDILLLEDGPGIERLFTFADNVRRISVGDGVLLRGLVEFSNYCGNSCFYCGLNTANRSIGRYRMTASEILDAVGLVSANGIKTAVLQSGEDDELDELWLADIIRAIKKKFHIAVTLSVGEKSPEAYKMWYDAGADRYLLKVETVDEKLYAESHYGRDLAMRVKCLDVLRDIGYQTGSGILIGLKGQTIDSIVRGILFFFEKELDMIGIGPFIPHQGTRFKSEPAGDVMLTLKTIALARIVTRNAHMPATTALGSLGGDHRIEGLNAGANVLMPNFTPLHYRKLYEIYPGKACLKEPSEKCVSCMGKKALSTGRFIDYSVGHSVKKSYSVN